MKLRYHNRCGSGGSGGRQGRRAAAQAAARRAAVQRALVPRGAGRGAEHQELTHAGQPRQLVFAGARMLVYRVHGVQSLGFLLFLSVRVQADCVHARQPSYVQPSVLCFLSCSNNVCAALAGAAVCALAMQAVSRARS